MPKQETQRKSTATPALPERDGNVGPKFGATRLASLLRGPKGLTALAVLQRWREEPRGRERAPLHYDDLLMAPQRLYRAIAEIVSDWEFNPAAQAELNDVLAAAQSYSDVAAEIIESGASDWWWRSLDRRSQSVLTSNAARPDIGRTRDFAAEHLACNPAGLPYGLLTTTSTRLGDEILAAQLCDASFTSRLGQPMGCWAVPVTGEARIFEIHFPSDYLALCESYPSTGPIPRAWPRHWRLGSRAMWPRWSAVARDWDGIHISVAGLLTATGVAITTGSFTCLLADINSEMTVWFDAPFGEPLLLNAQAGPQPQR